MNRELLRGDTFHVEVAGVSTAGFTRCSGLSAAVDVLEYREGGYEGTRCFADSMRRGHIVLERGMTRDRQLWDWFQMGDPRDGSVVLLDSGGREKMRWVIHKAWPCHWDGPELRADVCEIVVERLEIVYESIEWQMS